MKSKPILNPKYLNSHYILQVINIQVPNKNRTMSNQQNDTTGVDYASFTYRAGPTRIQNQQLDMPSII